MPKGPNILFGTSAIIFVILMVWLYYDTHSVDSGVIASSEASTAGTGADLRSLQAMRGVILEQRNNLSRLLNLKQQKLGQLVCEVRKC